MACKGGLGEDRIVELVLDPDFGGDLVGLARHRPIWILETETTMPLIDEAWRIGTDHELYEVNRIPIPLGDRERTLIGLLPTLHSHHNWSDPRWDGLLVRGVPLGDALRAELADWGFHVLEVNPDHFLTSVPGRNEHQWDFTQARTTL